MSHRLFVALALPPSTRDLLIDTMEGLEGARWQDEAQLHLTLRFIGECEAPLANDVAASLQSVRAEPFALELAGAGHFERRGRPHTLWAGAARSPALLDLHKSVERACRRAGCPPETRRFAPHVTLARLNAASASPAAWISRHGDLRSEAWTVGSFRLYESHLRAAGSLYEPVVRYQLKER